MTAVVTRKNIINNVPFTAAYGNETRLTFNLTLATGGIWLDSDHTDAIQVGDTLNLGIMPAGFELHDFLGIVSDAFTGSTTCSIGFAYVDGVDSTAVPQNAAYFVPATQALSSTAIFRKTAVTAPVKLPKDAYLTLLWAGAAADAVGVLDIDVLGRWTGLPA